MRAKLYHDVELGHAPCSDRGTGPGREARPLGIGVYRLDRMCGDRGARRDGVRALCSGRVSTDGLGLRKWWSPQHAVRDLLSPAVLGDIPVLLARYARRDGYEGMAIPLLERGLQWVEARLQRADDGRSDGARELRSSLIVLWRDGMSIR